MCESEAHPWGKGGAHVIADQSFRDERPWEIALQTNIHMVDMFWAKKKIEI